MLGPSISKYVCTLVVSVELYIMSTVIPNFSLRRSVCVLGYGGTVYRGNFLYIILLITQEQYLSDIV